MFDSYVKKVVSTILSHQLDKYICVTANVTSVVTPCVLPAVDKNPDAAHDYSWGFGSAAIVIIRNKYISFY